MPPQAHAIFRPFAKIVEATVPGCLEFALYQTMHNDTSDVDIIIVEQLVDPVRVVLDRALADPFRSL